MRAILTYHSIDGSGSPISVDTQTFDRQVAWLSSGRVRITSIGELVTLPATEDALSITFDDGFANFAEVAAPRLLAHGLPVTLFVVSGRVGTTNAWHGRLDPRVPHLPLLDWPTLGRLREQGITLGAHSRTHADLTQLTAAAVEDEVGASADAVQRETGERPHAFAYPYGRWNGAVSQAVARHYRYGCTTDFATLTDVVAVEELPRLDMYYFRKGRHLDRWGTPDLARFIKRRHRLRRIRERLTVARP